MIGVIRRRNILAHPILTIRCFGWQVFLKALVAGRSRTFLSLLADTKRLRPPKVKVPELIQRCIGMELQAKRIYERLEGYFSRHESVGDFFSTLARQEQSHAELLGLCREAASRSVWKEGSFSPCRELIPDLERQLEKVEETLRSVDGVADALRVVIRIEESEVNRVFENVVASTGSAFVTKLLAFQNAAETHIAFICDEIPKLAPELTDECGELRDSFFVSVN